MTFLSKSSLFLLFMLLIDWRNKCRWTLWKDKVFLCPCFIEESLFPKGQSRSQTMTFHLKIHFFFCLCYWLIEETYVAEHYERTKFDLYKDDISPVLTLTYVLMDNCLSLFHWRIPFSIILTDFNKYIWSQLNQRYKTASKISVMGRNTKSCIYVY